uniref:Wsv325-like protein n=1 Tax=Trachysalambria curvirostris nimavirus TaxID=2984282 RepID=A0A9C7BWT3_9VIRU|nr:MAG: wsv325-like protein [Trachysalambria curvirostris nimavirus]
MERMSILSDVSFVAFLVFNVIQMVTLITILIYAVYDVHYLCNSASLGIRSNRLMTDGGSESVSFLGSGAPRELVFRFRQLLEPERVGRDLAGGEAPDTEGEDAPSATDMKDRPSILATMKRGPTPHASTQSRDNLLFKTMGRDPLLYMSAATSKFVREYSPFRARAFMSKKQLANQLVCPVPLESGTAFVLPTGHVVNKAYGMTIEDLHTWNRPDSEKAHLLTESCARANPVHRINVFGFGGSHRNARAKELSSVETLVCNCPDHHNSLQEPDPTTYSSNAKYIMVDVSKKQVLFPGPGSYPLQSTQVTAVSSSGNGAAGEEDIRISTVSLDSDYEHKSNNHKIFFKPVYGTGLVTLPAPGAPLGLNCPCTDRPDGLYHVVSKFNGAEMSAGNAFLRRDVVGYLNANPTEAASLSDTGSSSSWLATGKAISIITCKGEKIVGMQ